MLSLLRLAGVVAAAHALSLSGSTYRINLDFGRETGTWMPPRWAVNAGRTEFTLDLTFEDAGAATVAYGDVALQTYNLPDTQVFAMMGLALFVGVLATRLGASLYK